MADVAAETSLSSADLSRLRLQLVADAGATLLVLLVATTLSVYKPWGMTPYGRRQVSQPIPPQRLTTVPTSNDDTSVRSDRESITSTPWRLYVLLGGIGLVLLSFVVLHLISGGLGGH